MPDETIDSTTDQRAPLDEQPMTLSDAEEAGVLPDEDRRVNDAVPVVDTPPPVVYPIP